MKSRYTETMEWEWQPIEDRDLWQLSLQASHSRRKTAKRSRVFKRIGLAAMMITGMIGLISLSSGQAKPNKPAKAKPVAKLWLPAKTPYRLLILLAAERTGVEPALLAGLVQAESDFQPGELSSAGATGLTQMLPETARSVGINDLSTPGNQLLAGARFLRTLQKQFHSNQLALAAYNAGPGAVQRYGGIPPYNETQTYVPRVLSYRHHYLKPRR